MHQDYVPIWCGEKNKLQEHQSGHVVELEKKGKENQSKSFHGSCLWFVWKNKDPCMLFYIRQVGVEGAKCNKRINLLDNFLQTSPYFIIYLNFRIFVQLEGSLLWAIFDCQIYSDWCEILSVDRGL